MKDPRANVWKCYGLAFTWSFLLIQAVLLPYFQTRGLSVAEVFKIQSVFALSLLLLDVPTGYFSDIFGRRRTLIAASVFKGLGGTVLVLGRGFGGMLAAYVLIGVANSFLSGTDVSMLYESHALIDGDKPAAARLRARQYFITYGSVTAAALLGAALSARSLPLAAAVNAAFAWLSLPIALSMEEPPVRRMSRTSHLANLTKVCRAMFLEDAALRRTILLTVLYSFAPVVALYSFQALWKERALPLAWFGLIAAAQNLTSGASGLAAEKVSARLGKTATLLVVALIPAAAFLGAGFGPTFVAVGCGALLEVLRAFVQVGFVDQINARLGSEHRATANSIVSFCNRSLVSALAPTLGWLTQTSGAAASFRWLGGAYGAVFVVAGAAALSGRTRTTRQPSGSSNVEPRGAQYGFSGSTAWTPSRSSRATASS